MTVGSGDCGAVGTSSTTTVPIRPSPRCERRLPIFPRTGDIHYRLARALQIVNRPEEARREAETVGRIRELLDPLTLGPKLDAAFSHLDEPAAFATLANLCAGRD